VTLTFAIRRSGYDMAFSVQSSLTSSLLMRLGDIPERVGFARQKLLTIPVTHEKGLPVRERYLSLVKPVTKERIDDSRTEIFWGRDEERAARRLTGSYRKQFDHIIAVAPGSVWKTKQWPKEYYTTLLQRIEIEAKGAKVLLVGGKEDMRLCEEILYGARSSATNLAGSLSVLETCAVVEKIDLMIANDSAPLHIANAVGTDVIAIFGPTVGRFGCFPFGKNDVVLEVDLDCRPCGKHGGRRCPRKHFRCMMDITPAHVFREISSHLEKNL
jgi:heptosyltransferase-2